MLEPPSSTDEQAKIAQLEALLSERAAEIDLIGIEQLASVLGALERQS